MGQKQYSHTGSASFFADAIALIGGEKLQVIAAEFFHGCCVQSLAVFWGGESRIRAHAPIGVMLAKISGAVDGMASGGKLWIESRLFYVVGIGELGERDFAGSGVGAFLVAVEFFRDRIYRSRYVPVRDLAPDLPGIFDAKIGQMSISF